MNRAAVIIIDKCIHLREKIFTVFFNTNFYFYNYNNTF